MIGWGLQSSQRAASGEMNLLNEGDYTGLNKANRRSPPIPESPNSLGHRGMRKKSGCSEGNLEQRCVGHRGLGSV